MIVDRFLAIIALGFAIWGICATYTDDILIQSVCFFGTCIIALVLFYLEKVLRNLQGEFINKFLYYFTRTKQKYTMNYEEARYIYTGKNKMEYVRSMDVKAKVNNLDRIEQKYAWSSYGKDVKAEPINKEQDINLLAPQNIWTRFEIIFNKRALKKEIIRTGFTVTGLIDELGIAKPFLSLSTDFKVKERKMLVKIPSTLKPQNGKFEIYQGGLSGRVIKSEPLEYDRMFGGYQKTIKFPRIGRTYSIVWEWGESS